MHQDDVRWVIVALRQMYDRNSNYGESFYRLLTRNGKFIYLQTRGYLEIDKCTNKADSFVCINTLLSEEEGRRRVQEMKDKFAVIIQTKIPNNSLQDVPASQNPQQLERIVLYLIENLQKRNDNTQVINDQSYFDKVAPTLAAPLALVPPEPASVRNSISRSVSVVQQQYGQKSPSGSSNCGNSEASLSPASSTNELLEENKCAQSAPLSPASLYSSILTSPSSPYSPPCETLESAVSEDIGLLDQGKTLTHTSSASTLVSTAGPAALRQALTHSWRRLDQSLNNIGQEASTLRQAMPVSHSIDRQLGALLIERNMQQKMLVHIKSEYDALEQQHSNANQTSTRNGVNCLNSAAASASKPV